jgi:hypothetical protein
MIVLYEEIESYESNSRKKATEFSNKRLGKRDKKEYKILIKYYKPLSLKKFKEGYFKINWHSYQFYMIIEKILILKN